MMSTTPSCPSELSELYFLNFKFMHIRERQNTIRSQTNILQFGDTVITVDPENFPETTVPLALKVDVTLIAALPLLEVTTPIPLVASFWLILISEYRLLSFLNRTP
ncbi:hypothetical protein EMIT0232MI5_30133 [Pseudomonas sp. IT-232MI5]